jgi:esterase/lipase superfamily enzyme
VTPATAPSRLEYKNLVKACADAGKHCLFFVHGYNKSFPETLEQGWRLQTRFGMETVLFSWPSNPGGLPPSEYRHARRIAQASFGALDSALEKLGKYMREEPFEKERLVECEITVNFMAYSLGNYLFQNYVISNEYAQETRLFSNVVLCQADVDSDGHESWVEEIAAGNRVYVTLNENDKVLGFSETVNYPRLGKTLHNLEADNAKYLDFTLAKGVGNTHQLWGEVNTKTVKAVFGEAFSGRRAEEVGGITFDPQANAYRVP